MAEIEKFDSNWMEKEFREVEKRMESWSEGMRGRYHSSTELVVNTTTSSNGTKSLK